MIPMGQYPAMLEGWVDSNANNTVYRGLTNVSYGKLAN